MTTEEFIKSISLEGEIWLPMKDDKPLNLGLESLYMISSFGRIVSVSREVDRKRYKFIKEPILLKPCIDKHGYDFIGLNIPPRITIHRFTHRLVASTFIPNPNNYPRVDHIDTNPLNNKVENLRWCTDSMNMLNPITRKRNSEARKRNYCGPIKPVVRINPNNPFDIKFYKSAASTRDDGFEPTHVCDVCRGNRPRHKGYYWKFLSDYEASNQ